MPFIFGAICNPGNTVFDFFYIGFIYNKWQMEQWIWQVVERHCLFRLEAYGQLQDTQFLCSFFEGEGGFPQYISLIGTFTLVYC